MKKVIFFLIIICVGLLCSQNRSVDSLSLLLKTAKQDTLKVNLLFQMSEELRLAEPKKSISFSEDGLKLAEQLNYEKGIAIGCGLLGQYFQVMQDNEKAEAFLLRALKLNKKTNNTQRLATNYNSLGLFERRRSNYKASISYFIDASKEAEKIGMKSIQGPAYGNIAAIYNALHDNKNALKYHFKSLQIAIELKRETNIGDCYNGIGIVYDEEKQYDSAISYYTKAIAIYSKTDYKIGLSIVHTNLGNSYALLGKNKMALEQFTKAINFSEEVDDKEGIAVNYLNMAGLCVQEGNFKLAIEYNKKGCEISEELGISEYVKAAYLSLAEIGERSGDYKSAFLYNKKFHTLNDSIAGQDNVRFVNELHTKYETEKKEKENLLLSKQNEIQELQLSKNTYFIFGLCIVIVLGGGIALLLFRQNKLSHEQRAMQLEQKLLRSQMNPHFIFNSLIAIESFIYKNEAKAAGKYLSGFAKLMRLILENSREEYVSLEKEVQGLEHYLNLQKLRYDDNFEYHIELDETIDPALISIPPMLAQPFIENSIEHGLKDLPHKGKINIRFTLKENELQFEVEDNGIGFERSLQVKSERSHRSLATTITMERLTILNKRKGEKIKWVAEDVKDEQGIIIGARVTFTIPSRSI